MIYSKKRLFFSLFLLLLNPISVHSECGPGTLQCEVVDGVPHSKICDFVNSFLLNETTHTCEKWTTDGCLLISFSKKACLLCNPKFNLDAESGKCTAIPPEQIKENCQQYDLITHNCLECSVSFFIENGKCTRLADGQSVEGCSRHLGPNQCLKCQSDFYQNADRICVPIDLVEGCHFHSNRKCHHCKAGYHLNPSLNTFELPLDSRLIQMVTSSNPNEFEGKWSYLNNKENYCEQTIIKNCLEFQTAAACLVCAENYFLTSEFICQRFPETPIKNCKSYLDATICEDCQPFFYLKSETECAAVTHVTNCEDYHSKQNTCAKCHSNFYLSIVGDCVLRQHAEVKNCDRFYVDQDKCNQCAGALVLSTDMLRCVEQIDNCTRTLETVLEEGKSVYDSTVKVDCLECLQTHFLADNQCHTRGARNCSKVEIHRDVCSECQHTFYLHAETNICTERTNTLCYEFEVQTDSCKGCEIGSHLSADNLCVKNTVTLCQTFVPNQNKCQLCNIHYFPKDGICEMQSKANCQNFKTNENLCETCMDGFYTDTGECKAQSLISCIQFQPNQNVCLKCSQNYFLEATACTQRTKTNCVSFKPDSNECVTCADNYFLQNHACEERTIANCLDFELNTNICVKCSLRFYLSPNGVCMPFDIAACAQYTPYQNKCTNCGLGTFKIENRCDPHNVSNCVQYQTGNNTCSRCASSYFLNSQSQCVKLQIQNCVEYNLNSDNCKTCSFGFFLQSNECIQQNVANCIQHTENAGTCSKCMAGNYLKDNVCETYTIANCILFSETEDKCSRCSSGFYLNGSFACTALTVNNCVESSLNTDECVTCNEGYALVNGKCQKTEYLNCQTVNFLAAECQICGFGFYLENKLCVLQNLANCQEYEINLKKCKTCQAGFYLDSNFECKTKNISECVQYAAGNALKCEQCLNLKAPSSDFLTCTVITNIANCKSSNGQNNDCLSCAVDYLLVNKSCTQTRDISHIDAQCDSNIDSTPTTQCNSCANGFFKVLKSSPSVASTFLETNNCLKINTTTGKCDQCKDLYELDANKSCLQPADTSSLLCARLIPDSTQTLADNLECQQCQFETLYYLESEVCTSRLMSSNLKGCSLFDPYSESCLACHTGLYNLDLLQLITCSPSTVDFSAVDNCVVYEDQTTCQICQQGYFYDQNALTCELITTDISVHRAFNAKMSPIVSIENLNAEIANCQTYVQVNETELACSQCQTDFVNIVPDPFTQTSDEYINVYSQYNPYGTPQTAPAFTSCVDDTTPFLDPYSDKHTEDNTCQIGFILEDYAGFGCLKCLPGSIGEIQKVGTDIEDYMIDPEMPAIGNCAEATDMTSTLRINHLFNLEKSNNILWNMLFPFTECTDPTLNTLIYMYILDTVNATLSLSQSETTDNSYLPQAFCLEPTQITGDQILPNCQIYVLSEEPADLIDLGAIDIATATCAFCKPGFKATRTDDLITSCDAIANCDISDPSKNTWMGECQTPLNGGWIVDESQGFQYINYHQPMADAIPNCQAAMTIDSQALCLICKPGYDAVSGICSPSVASTPNCESSLGYANIQVPEDAAQLNLQFANWVGLRLSISDSNYTSHVTEGCNKCATDFFPEIAVDNLPQICSTDIDNPQTIPDNCKYSDYQDGTTCKVCYSGFLFNPSDSTCLDETTYPECSQIQENDEFVLTCTLCKSGFVLDASSLCVASFCLETGEGTDQDTGDSISVCAVCETGKVLAPDNTQICEDGEGLGAECALESPYLGHCVQCTDPSKIPYIIKNLNDLNEVSIESWECLAISSSTQGYSNYNLDYQYIEVEINISTNEVISALKFVETKSQNLRLFTDLVNSEPPETHCVTSRDIPNCAESLGSNCNKCSDTYIVTTSGLCESSSIDYCLETVDNEGIANCNKCQDTHYKSGDSTECVLRLSSNNCKVLDETLDECYTCNIENWLDENTYLCKVYTVSNCDEKKSLEDACKTCLYGHWKDAAASSTCKPYTIQNCKTYSSSADSCDTCLEGYTKDQNQICVQNTGVLCSKFHSQVNGCETCAMGFYANLISKTCIANSVTNCQIYKNGENSCESCLHGFFLDSADKNCQKVTAFNCVTHHLTENKCLTCPVNYVLDESHSCLPNPASNCLGFKPSDTGCSQCALTFLLNPVSKNCILREARSCQSYDPSSDKCSVCATNMILNLQNGNCDMKLAKGCLEFETEKDACKVCKDNFILDESNKSCVKNVAQNCLTFNPTQAKCDTCASSYFKDPLNSTCSLYSAQYCQSFSPNSDSCLNCINSFYKLENGNCTSSPKENCLQFTTNLNECSNCAPGYLLNTQTKSCDKDTATHCVKYQTGAATCLLCGDGYWLDAANNTCNVRQRTNCLEFTLDQDQCLSCQTGSYLDIADNNSCKEYFLENCKIRHATKNDCLECEKLFWLDGAGGNICKGFTAQNCGEFQTDKDQCKNCEVGFWLSDSDKDECSSCQDSFFLFFDSDTQKQTCKNRQFLDCEVFSQTSDQCEACNQGLYLTTEKLCQKVDKVDKCLMYSTVENQCLHCDANHYKPSANNECREFPNGISGCVRYLFQDVCQTCDSDQYLMANECHKVPLLIEFCGEYLSQTECKACVAGKHLENNKCLDPEALNCLEYLGPKQCKTCKDGYLFIETDQTCIDSPIQYCDKPQPQDQAFICQKCQKGFVLHDANTKCSLPNSVIVNCQEYLTLDTCALCEVDYILSLDKKQCEVLVDEAGAHCASASEVPQHFCDVCQPGFQKADGGFCVQMKDTLCFGYDWTLNKCVLCQSGTYMDSEGACLKENSENPKPTSAKILASIWVLMSCLMVLAS